ncbi:MAG: hypothetical protein ACI8ZB_001701 [Desulforhopalus sp.]|jgi:hypothetical protein
MVIAPFVLARVSHEHSVDTANEKCALARISHQQSFSQVETPGMKL